MTGRVLLELDDVLATMRAPWPDGAPQVERHLGRSRPAAGDQLLLLSPGRPRALVPADSPAAAAAALDRVTAADTWSKAAGRRVLAWTVRTPLARAFPVVRTGTGPAAGFDSVVADLVGGEVRMSVAVGARRANAKTVLDLLRPDGQRIGFAKLASTELAKALVAHEAATLQRLGRLRLPDLDVPAMIAHGTWRDVDYLVLSAVTGSRGRRGRRPDAAMAAVAGIAQRGRRAIGSSAWSRRLRSRVADVPGDRGVRLVDVVEAFLVRHGTGSLEFGAWHGDWGPWNMAWRRDRAAVWDWERFDDDVPVGLDAVHFTAHEPLRLRDQRAATVALERARGALSALGVMSADHEAVVTAYVLEVAARFSADAARPGGDAVGRLADWYAEVAWRRLRGGRTTVRAGFEERGRQA